MDANPTESASRPTHLLRWLRIHVNQRPAVYANVYETAEFTSLSYWLEIVFSAGIAALGLVINSPAVIIGAMLISPLMGPIMALGLALAASDLYLAIKALGKLVASLALAIGLSAFIVWLLPFHSITAEIVARTNPNLLDLGIALFSGLAGSVAVCRTAGGSGVTTLPGVAIAVALMPPLCTVGFGLGSGANMRIMGGAGLLFLTNLVAIVASAFAVFLLVGMNAPDVRTQMASSRKDEHFAQTLSHGPLARILANGGQLRWRILMLVALLALVAAPLRRAFVQVAGEALARATVQDVVRSLVPAQALVTQQVEVGRDSIAVRLVATKDVSKEKVEEAERAIERRSGRKAEVSVSSIASQSELSQLMRRLSMPTPAPPKPDTLAEIQTELMARVQPQMEEIWPEEAPLQSFDLAFMPDGIVIHAEYASRRNLDPIALGLLEKELSNKLGEPGLKLNVKRVAPAKSAKN